MNKHAETMVSIIVPVYKVETYLEKCVDSILNQTYKNIEVILVDDGSPDKCPIICDQYAQLDTRVKVLHQGNGGLSSARNRGMELATGQYYMFVDSDDWIQENAVASLLDIAIHKKADIVIAGHHSIEDKTYVIKDTVAYSERLLSKGEAIIEFGAHSWGAWGKLYKAEIHEGINFPVGRIHEDEAIMFHLLDRCNIVCTASDIVYNYIQRKGSITALEYSVSKMDWFYAWQHNLRFIEEWYPTYLPYIIGKTWDVALYNLENLVGHQEYSNYIDDICSFIHDYEWKILLNSRISAARKIRLCIANISNLHKRKCLYERVYSALNQIRGARHA